MADIAEITNAEAGSSVRTKLNTIRTYINALKNLTGLVKVSGETLSAASAGTDYQAPLTKAAGSDIDTGSDDAMYVTSKAIADSSLRGLAISRTLIDSANFASGDIGKCVIMNKPTATTLTIPEALMAKGETIAVLQIGAGQVTIAVATPADQDINTACKTFGADTMVTVYCTDDTADAEIFKVIGGSE